MDDVMIWQLLQLFGELRQSGRYGRILSRNQPDRGIPSRYQIIVTDGLTFVVRDDASHQDRVSGGIDLKAENVDFALTGIGAVIRHSTFNVYRPPLVGWMFLSLE